MANLFDRLQETFTLQSTDNSNDASVEIKTEDSTKPNVTQGNNGDTASRQGLVSAYTVNKQDGGKTKAVKTTSSANADDAAKMKNESSFVIPKRKKDDTDILVDLMINSREFQYEILPAIVKSYRNAQSSEKFKYTKVQSVHNRDLLKLYLEKRKELRSSGYSDKEASDCVAFLCVEDEELMYKICRDGIPIGNYPQSCLGHPMMGVQLCKHADIIKSTPLHPNETGYLILFKIIKGRIKSVAESISENPLEPTPHYDCHVISTPPDASASPQSLFESSQVYMYEYGEEGVMQYPRNVCPVAVASFVYEKDSRDPKSNSPRVHHPVYRGGSAPLRGEEDKEFVVWSGSLTIKGLYACNVEMTSAAAFVKPAALGGQINISSKLGVKQVQQKYLKNVSGIRRSSEGYWNGYYINACELRPMSAEGRSHFQRVMNYLGKHNAVAVQKLKKDVTLLMLTQSELTYQLGLSRPHQYPVLLYCLFLSKTSARKRLTHTAAVHKESSHPANRSSKLPHPPVSPPFPPTNNSPIKAEEHTKTPQSSPFLPPSSPYSVPPSPKRDYYRSPSSNIVSWPQNPQFGSPRNLPVPHSTPPQSPIAYGTTPVPSTLPYGVPHSPQMSHGGPLHAPFHNPYQSPEFSGNSPQRRSSRDSQQGAPYPPESKSSFIPPSTFQSGPNFEPQFMPRPNFSPRSPYHFPPRTGEPRFQGPVQQFGSDFVYGGPRFPDPNWNFMQGPTFPDRFDPSRSPSLPSLPTCIPSDPKFNTPPYLKMHNVSNEAFHSPKKPDWSQGSPYPAFSPDRANNNNVQTTLHRSDPRLIKNASPKVNPVAPMPRGSTAESLGSPVNAGMVSPVDFSSAKMSPMSLPSPQQMPGPSGTPPLPQGPPVPPPPVIPLPEPPKPSRVSPAIPVSYDSGFLYKPPASSLLQPEKVKKVFEEQCVAQEIQQRAKEAIKRHLLARSRIESKKKQGPKESKMEEKKSEHASKEKMVESAEDMKQLLESSLDPKFAIKKKMEQVKKKEKPRPEGVKEKHKAKEKHLGDKLKGKAKHAEGRPKDKEGSVESVVKLKIPEPESFKLDSLEDIARMRKITEAEIKKESERLDMDDMDLDEDLLEEVNKKSKKRPKERENVDEKRRPSETDELSSKKAKIDTANDMKNFLNFSLEENKPQESVSSKSEVVGSSFKSREVVTVEEAKSVEPSKPASEVEETKEKSKISESKVNRNENVEESGSETIESKNVEAKNKSDVEKMETDTSDQSGRWDNPTKKKRQESESEGERKIENQKGKIIIIKEIRMIRVNSDGSEIKSPDKEAERPALEKGFNRPVSPVPIPLEENSKVTEKKDRNAETKRSERDGGKRRESKREVDKRRSERDERREKSNRKDERRAKERSGESHDRRKSEDSKKNLVHYSDSESTSSRSRSSSCRSQTPKSDDGRGSVPRYTKVYPDFKPSRPTGKYPKAASTSHNRSVSERKPGDQRRGNLHQRSRYQHDSKSYPYKKGKPGVSKRIDLQGFGKVKSVFHSRKDYKAQQAIIEGIITSAKMPLKKIPKIQKQKQPLSISTSTLDHATPSPLQSSEDMKDLSEDVQSNSSTTILEQTESQQQIETTNGLGETCELPIHVDGGDSIDSPGPHFGKLEDRGIILEVIEPERLETDHQTENKNYFKAPSADMEELSENEHHLKALSVDLKDPSTVEESMNVIEAEDHVKATSSKFDLPCDAVEATECQEEVCNIEKLDQTLEDTPVPLNSTKNTTESSDSQDKVSAQFLSKEDSVTSDIGNKMENSSSKKVAKKRSTKMERDLCHVMNQFLPQPERNVKENLDMNKESMEPETVCRNHKDTVGDSQEGRFMMNDLVDLETGRDFHQTNEVSSTFSLTSHLSNEKKPSNSVESSSISSHLDKLSDPQTCESRDFISRAEENKSDLHKGFSKEIHVDASHPEQSKKHRTVFSEAFHPGLDAGIVHGQWSDDLQTCSEDEFEPDTDRVVQDGPNQLELKITVTNDTPVESKFKWISREQLVKDCIHGKHDNSPYSLQEAILVNAINSVVHKTLPEKEGRVRSISTTEPTHNGDTEATDNENNSDDEIVYKFEEESFQLEKSPRLCDDEEATVVEDAVKEGQKPDKDSDKTRAAIPEVEKIINLVRLQFEDSNDNTTVSSLSSSQTSFRSLSSSQNSQDKFEKVLSDQLNSISQGLDLLMNFDSNSLSFITPDEGKQLNHVIENTMKTLKASMHSQNVDPGKTHSEITNTFKASEVRDQEKTEETANLKNDENTIESQSAVSNENSSKESVQEKKTDGPPDETAFWSKILGFSMQECKTLPSFFSTPPKIEKKADEDPCKEDTDVTVMSEISESSKKNTEDTHQVSGMDNVIVISDSPKSNDFVLSPSTGSSEKNKTSEVSQSNKMDTDLTQEVDEVIVISDSPISTNEIIKSPTPVNSAKSPEVNNKNKISSNLEEESKLDESSVTTESSQEESKDQRIHISPIRFPDSTFSKEIRKEKMTVTEEVLDNNNNTEVLNNTEEKDRNMIPKIQIDLVDEESKKSEQKEVRSGSKEDSSKKLLLNVGASDLRDRVKSKTPPLEVSVPAKKISPQEKTLTVIIPETKRKLIAQRQSPTLTAQTEAKKSESSLGRSPNILSEKVQLASGSETVPARLPTSQQSRRGSVFSRLSPLINKGEEVRKGRSESPLSEVRTIQLSPCLSSKNEQSKQEKGDGENKKAKSKKDDLVLITINNEKPESKAKKSRSRSRSSGGKKLSEYKPPPTSANAEPLSTQAGPIRNTGKSKREERQYHPYRKEPPKKKNTWSFDIAYDSLRELMHDLTVSSYKSQHHRPKHCRTNSRFANYTFVRSNVPETLPGGNPEDEEVDEEFDENAIPDFEERKRKADLVDELTLGEQEEDDYTTERQVYSMEDSEQPEQENVTKTEEPDRKILPRMLFNLPSRNVTVSSLSGTNKDIKAEEKELKIEPLQTEASRTVVKSERVIEIYRKTGPTKRENSPSNSDTLDCDARGKGKKENTEQVSNNDSPLETEVKTQSMETENSQSQKTTVHFLNPSAEGVEDDEDLELDECSDWIVLDDASDDIGNSDPSTLCFDKEALPGNVNQNGNSESHLGSTGNPDVNMKEEIHDIFSVQGTCTVDLRPNPADICKSVFDGERDISECYENTISSVTADSEAKMEETNDICMEEAESTLRSGNIIGSRNEINDSNSRFDKTVLEVQDMSVSEEEGAAKESDQEVGESFVPVIYLKGVSGKNFWCRNESHKVEEDDDCLVEELDQDKESGSINNTFESNMDSNFFVVRPKSPNNLEKVDKEKFWCRNESHKVEEDDECLVEELDQDKESGSIDNTFESNMDSNSSVVRLKSPDNLEKVDKEKPKVSKFADLSLLEKEFASYIGRGSTNVEYNSPVEDLKTSDDMKVESDKDTPTVLKSAEIFLAENEFASYIGRGLSHVKTKILTASPETSSIIGTTSFEQPLVNISSPSSHTQEADQDTNDLKEAESQCDYQKPDESEHNSEKETGDSEKVALKFENENKINSNKNVQTNTNNNSQEVRQNEQVGEGKDLMEADVNYETNEEEDEETTTFDKSHEPKYNANSFAEATSNFKDTMVGVVDSKETSDAPKEEHETESRNQHPTDLEKHLDLAVKSIENDLSFSGCCSVNATSTPNKKSFHSAQSVPVNISDSLDDKIDDSVWMCNTEKGEELSSTEKGEGLGLLMKNYDQYSGSESFNSSAELSSNQNVLGINADNVEDSLKETCQERDLICDPKMSSVTKNAEKIDQNTDIELKEGKAEEADDIENPREADSSFDTEQRLEDIMSVIGESQPEIYLEGSVRHSSQIKVLTISSSECDLCDDQLCLAKVKCLTGPLDPLEEAMLSSGILDINDVPMGNEIEIDSDDPVNILHINHEDKILDEEKETTVSDSFEFLPTSESPSNNQTSGSYVYTAAPCYTTDKLTGVSDCESPRCLDSEVEDEGDTSSTETDYISDSVDSETEAATRGDDWSKLIVSEYLHTKQSNKVIDTACNLPQTKSVKLLHSNHSQKNQESSGQKEVSVDCSKPSKPLSQSINRQVQSKMEPVSQSVYKKNQSIVRPLVPNSRGLSTALAMKSTASNSMCSAPLLRQLMMQNSSLSGPRFSMMPPHQISLNPLMLFYTQSQFPSYSNAARTLTPLPLFFPYATNYPTGPQVNPMLSMPVFPTLSPSPAFELTTDKFEAFRKMNNGSEPHFQSSLLGTVPLYGSMNPPQSPMHCSSLPSPCITGSFYMNRQVTQERSTKITECLRSSSMYSTTDGSPLLPPISSFTQRKVSNMNGAENAFSSCKSPPAQQNIVNQQSSHALYNKEISSQIHSENSFQKTLSKPAALSPLDMTVSTRSNTGSSQKQAPACSRNLFENLNQNLESLQQTTREKRTPGKIPVGHVRPMSFSSFRDFQKY